nr:uncharacterized protein LOC110356232 [Columba livia]
MEQRPPSSPQVAWEEVNVPQAIRPRRQPDEVTRFRLLPHTSWLPVYEFRRDNLDFIVKFIESPANSVGEKLRFLGNVCELCKFSKNNTAPKGLGTFCCSDELLENVRPLESWSRTLTPPPAPWQFRPCSSSPPGRISRDSGRPCGPSAAGAAKPGLSAAFLTETPAFSDNNSGKGARSTASFSPQVTVAFLASPDAVFLGNPPDLQAQRHEVRIFVLVSCLLFAFLGVF